MFCGVGIDDNTKADLKTVAWKGSNRSSSNSKWKGIETEHKHHKTKYDHGSVVHPEWGKNNIKKMCDNMKTQIYDKLLNSGKYIIGRKNLLKNSGLVDSDQLPHADYSP